MRLLYIHFSLAITGGIERVLVDKMNYFANKDGYRVYFLTYDQGNHPLSYKLDDRISYKDLNICFHRIYKYIKPIRFFVKYQLTRLFEKRLRDEIKDISPDIIIGTEWTAANSILRNKRTIPYVLESHFGFLTILNMRKSNIFKKMILYNQYKEFAQADTIVALTKGDANLWHERHAKRVQIIPNVVHLNNGSISEQKEKKVIFVGRLSEEKDIPSLLKIWRIVYSSHKDWKLDIYGDGELKDDVIRYLNNNDENITLHEPSRDIFDIYRNSSVLLVTSKSESFGLVLLEAMSCAVPVIAFDCPFGPKDIICDGENGFLIRNRNVESFANKLCLLMNNKDLRIGMGIKAIQTANSYSAEIIMPKWEKLFDDLTSNICNDDNN